MNCQTVPSRVKNFEVVRRGCRTLKIPIKDHTPTRQRRLNLLTHILYRCRQPIKPLVVGFRIGIT